MRPRKSLSQSFLEDQGVAAAIVRAAHVAPSTDVLEVGPGLGVLTDRLARLARHVVAVEIDAELADGLRSTAPANVSVVTADVLIFDPSTCFADEFTVVANLPYHVSSPALRHLLAAGPPFARRLVLMLQAEVAQRIAAQPGELSALAVTIQVQAGVELLRRVAADAFYPRPKVDSAVVVLEPLAEADRAISRQQLTAFTSLVQAGFKQPRKTLVNSLSDGLNIPRIEAAQRLREASIDPGLRPQALAIADWVRLFETQ